MSHLTEPEDVKLICSVFSPEERMIRECIEHLEEIFGPADWVGPPMFFDRTKYYEKEMGWPLHRRFVSFTRLIRPERIVEAKLTADGLEQKYSREGMRRVNIDPGYVSLERLVLATGKNYTHRVYLSKGVYADLTLLFQRGTFRSLEWTFPDYASSEMIGIFNEIRTGYKEQLRRS
ncbi:MAG: DUF4416 domain-containing protein [Deltaproteobacteria bacterium HGW-Deltaproteobacteria-15]|jgi:hypothetical protein|nr:MAG: DUF4416 domain-containing protein [Deltaproteobacteria bacterium HGW-Deltaproteobacteria-15]